MRGWERRWSSKNGAHPGMEQSGFTWQVTASGKRKTRLRMMVGYSEAMRWLTINRRYTHWPRG